METFYKGILRTEGVKAKEDGSNQMEATTKAISKIMLPMATASTSMSTATSMKASGKITSPTEKDKPSTRMEADTMESS